MSHHFSSNHLNKKIIINRIYNIYMEILCLCRFLIQNYKHRATSQSRIKNITIKFLSINTSVSINSSINNFSRHNSYWTVKNEYYTSRNQLMRETFNLHISWSLDILTTIITFFFLSSKFNSSCIATVYRLFQSCLMACEWI